MPNANHRSWGRSDPRWVDAILAGRWTWRIARIALTIPFIVSGMMKLSDPAAAAAEMERFGMHPGLPWAWATIVVEGLGPLMIVAGRYVWFGAGMLAVFTFIANFLANRFWDMAGAARIVAINDFFEHIALVGGFVMAALAAELEQRRSMLEGKGRDDGRSEGE